MTMHTKEPWHRCPDDCTLPVELSAIDYRRACACVDALANRDPSKLAELEAGMEHLIGALRIMGAGLIELADATDKTLAAFRSK